MAPTYKQRVEEVFSNLAKDEAADIPSLRFKDVCSEVRRAIICDGEVPGPRYIDLTRRAVVNVVRARRLTITSTAGNADEDTLTLTPSGVSYFKWYGVIELYSPDDQRYFGMTTLQANRRCWLIVNVLDDIMELLKSHGRAVQSRDEVAAAVEDCYMEMHKLSETRDELWGHVGDQSTDIRTLQANLKTAIALHLGSRAGSSTAANGQS